ncbi:oxidoreductase family protein [Frankia sp. Cas4]|uniref:oxidoreductase family protein n=1 Tax=Frankia sp. Cas4 TaxID=3073927 RepID=UPI002AD32B02|nr:oxidoreductase family protein [Frankia sp. Cas4]
MTAALPSTIDDITPEWLTMALGTRLPGVEVVDVAVDEVLRGTATKVFVQPTYGDGDPPPGAPGSVCVKGAFEDNAALMAATGIYEREAVFYRDLAPGLPPTGTAAWFADADSRTRLGVVVLDDLRREATFCRATSPLSIDEVAAGLELIARYHGATYAGPVLHEHPALHSYVTRDNPSGHYFATMDAERVAHFLALPLRSAAIPMELHRPDLVIDLFWRWVDQSQEGPWVLTHGDDHIGNWFRRHDGTLGLVDWQTICRMRPAHDVAYFITSALDVDDRRAAERDLLRSYHGCLTAAGVQPATFDELWLDYRRHMAFGLMAWLTSLEWMNPEPIHAAAVGRFAHAVLDLEVASALGRAPG